MCPAVAINTVDYKRILELSKASEERQRLKLAAEGHHMSSYVSITQPRTLVEMKVVSRS